MAMTLLQIREEVLERLQKTSGYQGFYTPEKCLRMINESLTFVAAKMMRYGFGWTQKIGYVSTTAGVASYALPTECAIIKTLRYKQGDIYQPIPYDSMIRDAQDASGQSAQYPTSYRLLERNIYFNPPPSDAGTNYIQLEYLAYPAKLVADSDVLNSQFEPALEYYLIWRTCSLLTAGVGKSNPEWGFYETQWMEQMEQALSRRVDNVEFIGEFRG